MYSPMFCQRKSLEKLAGPPRRNNDQDNQGRDGKMSD